LEQTVTISANRSPAARHLPAPGDESPALPVPRGPLSTALIRTLYDEPGAGPALTREDVARADPFGNDLQLALYCAYELHYRSFRGIDAGWEWDPELLRARGAMERRFLAALRDGVKDDTDVPGALEPLLTEPVDGSGVSSHLQDAGEWWQVREYLAHRSLYHLKEADPQAWVIPRLTGQAKASLVAVEFDEYGGGRGDRVHARLFAEMMAEAGLDPAYGRYLDAVPAPMLAVVNLMSMFGLHRDLRGAMVGHFAAVEISSPPGARRMAEALQRLGAGPACLRFYIEHVQADAVHEQVMRHEVIEDLLGREPGLARDVVFGIRATGLVEDRLRAHLIGRWADGRTSLRTPLPESMPATA
jgi:Iron-containing redox enzyme